MKKSGIFNSEIACTVASMGHKDMIAIVDLGFPIPHSVKKIDLVVDKNLPSLFDVLNVVVKELEVERFIVAKESSEDFLDKLSEYLPDAKRDIVSHEELKEISKGVKAIIRTGEAVPYSNVILVSGVIF